MSLTWPGRASFDDNEQKKYGNKTGTYGSFFDLSAAVGRGGENRRDDVVKVEGLLANTGHHDLRPTDGPTGYAGGRLDDAVKRYQRDNSLEADGLLNPGGPTIGSLGRNLSRRLRHHRPPSAREVGRHHDAIALGRPPLVSYRAAAAKLRPAPGLPKVSDADAVDNGRTLDTLRGTRAYGDLPKYLAEDMVADGARGVARVRDLVERTGREIGPDSERDLLEPLLAHLPPEQRKILLDGNPPPDIPLGVALDSAKEKRTGPKPATRQPDHDPKSWAARIGAHGRLTDGLAEWVADTAQQTAPQARADLETFARALHARDPKLARELGEKVLDLTPGARDAVAAMMNKRGREAPSVARPGAPDSGDGDHRQQDRDGTEVAALPLALPLLAPPLGAAVKAFNSAFRPVESRRATMT